MERLYPSSLVEVPNKWWALKNCWFQRNFGCTKILGLKTFGSKEIVGSKKFWAKINFGAEKNFVSKKFLIKILKKNWVRKNFWSGNFIKKFGPLKNVGTKGFIVPRTIRTILGLKLLGPKKLRHCYICQGTVVQGDIGPRDSCPRRFLLKEAFTSDELANFLFYSLLDVTILIVYKMIKNYEQPLMFQTFTLDNSLLGPMSPWTKVFFD